MSSSRANGRVSTRPPHRAADALNGTDGTPPDAHRYCGPAYAARTALKYRMKLWPRAVALPNPHRISHQHHIFAHTYIHTLWSSDDSCYGPGNPDPETELPCPRGYALAADVLSTLHPPR